MTVILKFILINHVTHFALDSYWTVHVIFVSDEMMIVYGTVITHIALKIALPFLFLSPSGRCRLSNFRFKDVRIMQDDPSLNFTCGYCRLFMDVRNLRGDLSVYCFNLSFFFKYLFFHFLFYFNNDKYFRCSNSLGHWFSHGSSFDSASPESIRPCSERC